MVLVHAKAFANYSIESILINRSEDLIGQINNHRIYLAGTPHDPNAFSNITYVDVKLEDVIQRFLKEQKEVTIVFIDYRN